MLFNVKIQSDVCDEDMLTEKLFACEAESVSSTVDDSIVIVDALFSAQNRESLISRLDGDFTGYAIEEVDDSWKNRWSEGFSSAILSPHTAVIAENAASIGYRNEIVLNPNGAFGAGTHPTTKLCIQMLEELFSEIDHRKHTLVDVGTGSGIAAIYACMRGMTYVEAFDIDTAAVASAMYNAALNDVAPAIRQGDIGSYESRQPFDVVVANLQTEIIEKYLDNILDLVAPKGYMVISGILNIWLEQVTALFLRKGLVIKKTEELDSWLAFLLVEE